MAYRIFSLYLTLLSRAPLVDSSTSSTTQYPSSHTKAKSRTNNLQSSNTLGHRLY